MDELGSYKVELKNMRSDMETYQYHLNASFFEAVESTLVKDGELDVTLRVRKTAGAFELTFQIKGCVKVPCDLCLEDMDQGIDAVCVQRVKLGDAYSDEGELIVVPYEDGCINVAWNLYEFIVLEIPMKHVHEPGKCSVTMMNALGEHLIVEEYTSETDTGESEKPIDPRWSELKKIIDNN
jgi:uncharacterized metal-binding protein YceD (DUF177 family)